MLDLDYSSSESDSEEVSTVATTPPPSKPASSSLSALLPKPKARKLRDAGDKDAPKKIIVNLPKLDDEDDEDGRPAKKSKTGVGSGLFAMLPAPKRSGAAKNAPSSPPWEVKATAFETPTAVVETVAKSPKVAAAGSSAMFVPQSVSRKPIQPTSAFRKKKMAVETADRPGIADGGNAKIEPAKPKISLFGSMVANNPRPKPTKPKPAGEYKPMMLDVAQPVLSPMEHGNDDAEEAFVGGESNSIEQAQSMVYAASQPLPIQDLDTLAREAGLDDIAMRQLYGRHGHGKMPVKIATFSVDEEYRQNELDREAGLAQEVKPVRTVAPGRHQLSSLLNVAQSQKSALEDSFARGKANRKESSSRYGW